MASATASAAGAVPRSVRERAAHGVPPRTAGIPRVRTAVSGVPARASGSPEAGHCTETQGSGLKAGTARDHGQRQDGRNMGLGRTRGH